MNEFQKDMKTALKNFRSFFRTISTPFQYFSSSKKPPKREYKEELPTGKISKNEFNPRKRRKK